MRARQGTRAAHYQNAALTGSRVEGIDPGDEVAPIGEIDVVRCGRNAGAGHIVGLTLEWPGGMHHQLDPQTTQLIGEPGAARIQSHTFRSC